MTTEPDRPFDLAALGPVLATALDPVVVMDAAGRVADWNRAAETVFGWDRREAIGQALSELIVPERLRAAHWQGLRRYLDTGKASVLGRRIDIEAVDRGGRLFPVELSITEWRAPGGVLFLGFIRDVSEQRRNQTDLREAEARLRATHEHAQVGIGECDPAGRFLRVNAALCDLSGYSRDELVGRRFLDITHPEDRMEDEAAYERQKARPAESYVVEKRYVRKNGEAVWVQVNGSAVTDSEGRFAYGVRVVLDINARRQFETRQHMLIEELNHRVKNTLATVASIARQTVRGSPTLQAFDTSFQARLQALSETHNLLSRERWAGVDLRDLMEAELGHHRSLAGVDLIMLEGPPLHLSPAQSLGLALIVHELTTNAAKYGALSNGGAVSIDWRVTDGGRIQLCWAEDGAVPVQAPEHHGFGSKLIRRVAEGDLQGEATFEWAPAGLRFTLRFPQAT